MEGLIKESIMELFFQSMIIIVPFTIIYWLVKSIRSYVNTPSTDDKARKKHLKVTVITCFLLAIVAVSAVMFRQNLIATYKQLFPGINYRV